MGDVNTKQLLDSHHLKSLVNESNCFESKTHATIDLFVTKSRNLFIHYSSCETFTLTKYASKKTMKLRKIGNSIEEFYGTFSCTLDCVLYTGRFTVHWPTSALIDASSNNQIV